MRTVKFYRDINHKNGEYGDRAIYIAYLKDGEFVEGKEIPVEHTWFTSIKSINQFGKYDWYEEELFSPKMWESEYNGKKLKKARKRKVFCINYHPCKEITYKLAFKLGVAEHLQPEDIAKLRLRK